MSQQPPLHNPAKSAAEKIVDTIVARGIWPSPSETDVATTKRLMAHDIDDEFKPWRKAMEEAEKALELAKSCIVHASYTCLTQGCNCNQPKARKDIDAALTTLREQLKGKE